MTSNDGKALAPEVKTFVEYLRELRRRTGLTSARLEFELDIAPASLSRYLDGDRLPRPELLQRFQDWVAKNTETGLTQEERQAGWDMYYAAALLKNPVLAHQIEINNLDGLWAERTTAIEQHIDEIKAELAEERKNQQENEATIVELQDRLNQFQTLVTLMQKERLKFATMIAKSTAAEMLRELAAGAHSSADLKETTTLNVNVTIYLSDQAIHGQVEEAVEDLLASAAGHIEERDDPQLGSWYRRMRARLVEVERSVPSESHLVHAADATATDKMIQNVGPLIAALQSTSNAVIRVGALLLVKADGVLTIHQLTPEQQLLLDDEPQLARSPRELLSRLQLTEGSRVQQGDEVGDRPAPQR